jgi:hypothetical protein
MHNELTYQAKIHTISENLSKVKKNSTSFSPFFFMLKKNKTKKNGYGEKK